MPVGRHPDRVGIPMRQPGGAIGRGLGDPGPWTCVSCGEKDITTRIEDGCPACGAGKPQPTPAKVEPTVPLVETPRRREPPVVPHRSLQVPSAEPGIQKIYRLIEYSVRDLPEGMAVLQRSLVGTLEMSWGTMTAIIVDDVSVRQQDLLTVAKRQPGIWVGGSGRAIGLLPVGRELGGFESRRALADRPRTPLVVGKVGSLPSSANPFAEAAKEREMAEQTGPVPPTTEDRNLATMLIPAVGYRGAYTIAQALSMYGEQVATGSLEPEKHYTTEECYRLAQALLDLIPADWNPEPVEGEGGPEQPTIAEG